MSKYWCICSKALLNFWWQGRRDSSSIFVSFLNIEDYCIDLEFAQFLKGSLLCFFQVCYMSKFSMQFFHIHIILIQSNGHKIIINKHHTYKLMQIFCKQI